jgi:hypothetical protein
VLKFIGFTDSSGGPTERWKQFRGQDHGAVLAEALQLGYFDLFSTYPDACARTSPELQNFFSTKTSAGQRAVQYTVQTFKALCEQADFSSSPSSLHLELPTRQTKDDVTAPEPSRPIPHASPGLAVNINIQLTIPESSDEGVYDRFFAAFKKHLLTPQSGGD